jgi:hypothetical protein
MTNTLTRYSGSTSALSSCSDSYALSGYGGGFTQALAATNLMEQGRALLASTALENVGALSAMEGYLGQVAPSGVHRYKAICDAYTAAVCRTILDWDW